MISCGYSKDPRAQSHTHLLEKTVKRKGYCSVANSHIFQAVPRESQLFNYIKQISKLISLPKRPSDMMCTTSQNVCLVPKEKCAVRPNGFIIAIYFDAKAVVVPFIFVAVNQKISMVALGSIK